MKKFVSMLLCLMLLLPAAALAEDGWFAAADLSEEESNLLTVIMMDEMWGPYDFKAPDGATHLSLTMLELKDGQWVEVITHTNELRPVAPTSKITLSAWLTEDGDWESEVMQNKQPADGRIYINPVDPPYAFGMMIWQPVQCEESYSNIAGVYFYPAEHTDTANMSWFQRVFLSPEENGPYQQKAVAVLNEPVLLEIYVCSSDLRMSLPSFSEFNDPDAFAGLDYAFAVTATFTD